MKAAVEFTGGFTAGVWPAIGESFKDGQIFKGTLKVTCSG